MCSNTGISDSCVRAVSVHTRTRRGYDRPDMTGEVKSVDVRRFVCRALRLM